MNFVVINIILAFSGLTLAKLDMSKICLNNNVGDVIPNPEDCSSYILCESVAIVSYCAKGLHFDAIRNICSLPDYARCRLESPENSFDVNAQDIRKREDTNKVPGRPEIEDETNIYYSPFVAIDVMTGLEVDPMVGYDPEHVVCRHFGAYFLPHPLNCRSYILCAYGHIHRHSCGRGAMWNFRKQQCEIRVKAECYSKSLEDDTEIASTLGWSTDNPLMVCYTITATTTATTTTEAPTSHSWQPTGSSYNATATGSAPFTTTKPLTSTTAATTIKASSPSVTSTKLPNLAGPSVMECPTKTQSYLAHPKDCSKYYMCIMGIPVLTSCPVGLYWDSEMEYCDLAKNVLCFQRRT